jgi:hypothetical protein
MCAPRHIHPGKREAAATFKKDSLREHSEAESESILLSQDDGNSALFVSN